MRVYGEAGFDIVYLVLVIGAGVHMLRTCEGNRLRRLFGVMALVLGIGDAFHLVPRVIALLTAGVAPNTPLIGMGKLITSLTMTVFYVLMYHAWERAYGQKNILALLWVYALAILRVALCVLPQNQWFVPDPPYWWGIWRNIPFVLLGVLMVCLLFLQRKRILSLRLLFLAVALSFLFYIPVVVFADIAPELGMLMIPKTVCYLWMVLMFMLTRSKTDAA